MHDSSQVPGADFTSDIERFFFLEPASGDPIGDGTTDNFQRFVLVNQPFSHLHYPCNIEPSQAGTQTFTLGSVIRLRFQLTNNSNCSGGFEAGAQAELSVVRKTADGPVFQPVKSGSNTANIFSYNFNNNRYVYQLKTNGYAPGPHCATVVFHTFDAGALPFTTCFNIVP